MTPALRRLALAGLAGLLALPGCASPRDPVELYMEQRFAVPETSPLGGDSLGTRKLEMRRARLDMEHFLATLDSLRYRRDRSGSILFRGFLNAYLGTHLDPLLQGELQSEHPELLGLDANLRLVHAEVLVHLREPGRLEQALDELERRFAGRGDMLVDYPVGQQTTLAKALELLRQRKWRG